MHCVVDAKQWKNGILCQDTIKQTLYGPSLEPIRSSYGRMRGYMAGRKDRIEAPKGSAFVVEGIPDVAALQPTRIRALTPASNLCFGSLISLS